MEVRITASLFTKLDSENPFLTLTKKLFLYNFLCKRIIINDKPIAHPDQRINKTEHQHYHLGAS